MPRGRPRRPGRELKHLVRIAEHARNVELVHGREAIFYEERGGRPAAPLGEVAPVEGGGVECEGGGGGVECHGGGGGEGERDAVHEREDAQECEYGCECERDECVHGGAVIMITSPNDAQYIGRLTPISIQVRFNQKNVAIPSLY